MPFRPAEVAELFERVAGVLSQSAELAREHAARCERAGDTRRAQLERGRARRAEDAAERGRHAAQQLRDSISA